MDKNSVLNSELLTIVKGYQAEMAAERTAVLRKNAQKENWPSAVWGAINIKPKDKGVVATYPTEIKSQIMNLEYGTPNKKTAPVIRSVLWEAN